MLRVYRNDLRCLGELRATEISMLMAFCAISSVTHNVLATFSVNRQRQYWRLSVCMPASASPNWNRVSHLCRNSEAFYRRHRPNW